MAGGTHQALVNPGLNWRASCATVGNGVSGHCRVADHAGPRCESMTSSMSHGTAALIIWGGFCLTSPSLFAASELTIGSGITAPGGTVNLPLSLTTDDHVAAMQVDVQFDAADVSSGAVSTGTAYVDHILAYNVVSPGVLRLVIYSPTNSALGSGTLGNIQFDVAAQAMLGFSDLTLTSDLLANNLAGPVAASSVNGTININDSASQADLQIVKTVPTPAVGPGAAVTYTITVTNNGPDDVVDAKIVDTIPAGIIDSFWSCSASAGSACTKEGDGHINDLADIDSGGAVTYSLSGTFQAGLTQDVTNTAQVIPPASVHDPNFSNNVDQVVILLSKIYDTIFIDGGFETNE